MNAYSIANHILWRANRDAKDISPLKLQKMMYFLHGWYLAITGDSLIDEGFIRWQYGPVVPSVYHALKDYRSLPIDDYIKQYHAQSDDFVPLFVDTKVLPKFNEILERVWSQYSEFSATQLSSMSHEAGGPWSRTMPNDKISDDLIKEYFVQLAYKNEALANE
jgi:uncharacterized phage-associated protein